MIDYYYWKEPCIRFVFEYNIPLSTKGCMVKVKAGNKNFKLIPIITGMVNMAEVNYYFHCR